MTWRLLYIDFCSQSREQSLQRLGAVVRGDWTVMR